MTAYAEPLGDAADVTALLTQIRDRAEQWRDQLTLTAAAPARAHPAPAVVTGGRQVREQLETVLRSATHSVVWSRAWSRALAASSRWGGMRTVSAQLCTAVHVRMLLHAGTGEVAAADHAFRPLQQQGAQVRIVEPGPEEQELLLVDGARAYVATVSAGEPQLHEVDDPLAVRCMSAGVEAAWRAAHELQEARRAPRLLDGATRQAVLSGLIAGSKDETIARTAGISLRTCRRHVADIMAVLESGSRFQAGFVLGRAGCGPSSS